MSGEFRSQALDTLRQTVFEVAVDLCGGYYEPDTEKDAKAGAKLLDALKEFDE